MSSKPGAPVTKDQAERRTSSLTGLARQGIDTFVWWQKLALDFSLRGNAAVAAAQARLLDVAATQANATIETSVTLVTGAVNGWVTAAIGLLDEAAKSGQARVPCSDWNRIERDWKEYRARVRERWDRLNDDDLDAANGKRDELSQTIQRKYGISREDAGGQLDEFARQLLDRAGHAISAGGGD